MRARRVAIAVALTLVVLAAAPSRAQDIWVTITSPADGDFVIGELDVVAEVVARADVAEVEFSLDGRPIGTLTMEPYQLHVDLGDKNSAHRFSVVARDVEGHEATHSVTTQPIPIAAHYEVELQQLYVTVTRGEDRVRDLERDAFEVIDEGRPQELVTFARGDIPFTAVLLIDASASMYGDKIEAAIAGAASFVQGMRDLDQAQVMVFSDQLLTSTPITDTKAVLTAGLSGTEARGGTALQDHMYVALKLLEQRQGRRVLILLSDGIDTHSVLPMDLVFDAARKSNSLIYWIRIERHGPSGDQPQRLSSAWKSPEQYRAQRDTLDQTVLESGGRILGVSSPDDIGDLFIQVLWELREQYVLGYYPDNRRNDGAWHRVRVRVSEADVDVRAPKGYIDH